MQESQDPAFCVSRRQSAAASPAASTTAMLAPRCVSWLMITKPKREPSTASWRTSCRTRSSRRPRMPGPQP